MLKAILRFLCVAPVLCGLCGAQSPLDCVAEMTIPNATPGIRMFIPATVYVRVTIGKNGLASSVDYGDAKPLLGIALDQYFKEDAHYVPACAGRTIGFTVRYVVEGERTYYPVSKVHFRQPDEFVIIVHPPQPSLDPAREVH